MAQEESIGRHVGNLLRFDFLIEPNLLKENNMRLRNIKMMLNLV